MPRTKKKSKDERLLWFLLAAVVLIILVSTRNGNFLRGRPFAFAAIDCAFVNTPGCSPYGENQNDETCGGFLSGKYNYDIAVDGQWGWHGLDDGYGGACWARSGLTEKTPAAVSGTGSVTQQQMAGVTGKPAVPFSGVSLPGGATGPTGPTGPSAVAAMAAGSSCFIPNWVRSCGDFWDWTASGAGEPGLEFGFPLCMSFKDAAGYEHTCEEKKRGLEVICV